MTEEELASRQPGAYRYLCERRRELERRGSKSMTYPAWYAHWCPRSIERFTAPEIVTAGAGRPSLVRVGWAGGLPFRGRWKRGRLWRAAPGRRQGTALAPFGDPQLAAFDRQVRAHSSRFAGGYFSFARRFIENAIIPNIGRIEPAAELPAQSCGWRKPARKGRPSAIPRSRPRSILRSMSCINVEPVNAVLSKCRRAGRFLRRRDQLLAHARFPACGCWGKRGAEKRRSSATSPARPMQ